MKYCNHCHVKMSDAHDTCPVCGRNTQNIQEEPKVLLQEFPKVQVKASKATFVLRVMFAISVGISLIVGYINYLTYDQNPTLWSLIIIGILFYMWLFIYQVVLTKKTYSKRILHHVVGVSILLVLVDLITGWQSWSLTYTIPFILLGTTIGLPIVVVYLPKKFHTQVTQLLKLILLDAIPILLYYITPWFIKDTYWPAFSAVLSGLILLLCMFIIAPRTTIHEIYKQLHI